jgi:hypothetical protein
MQDRCGAKLRKKPGVFCKKFPVPGRNRCYLHNGNAASGAAIGTFKHGRYSKVLPQRLLQKYETARKDPELLSHQAELRLIDAHLGELLEKIKDCNGPDVVRRAREVWKDLQAAKANHDNEGTAEAFDTLGEVLASKEGNTIGWSEVREVVDLRRKILETETRRLKDSEATLTLEQSLTMIGFLNDAIRKAVNAHTSSDIAKLILTKVSQDFGRLVGVSDDASARPAAKVIN